jgi:AcrR family transcriptional regulator
MPGSRQAPDRSRQRARTHQAIVAAAAAMLRQGHQPTVAEAAAAAGVHRGTAYRYFPTPQALLTDAALTAGAPDPAEMYRDIPADDALALMDAGVRAVSDYMFREEALFRNIVRVTIDRWFAQQRSSDPNAPPVRQTRRFGPIDRALEPLRGTLSQASLRRLRYALCLVYGAEALIVTRDVAGLEPEEATDIMRWAARALISQALADESEPTSGHVSRGETTSANEPEVPRHRRPAQNRGRSQAAG